MVGERETMAEERTAFGSHGKGGPASEGASGGVSLHQDFESNRECGSAINEGRFEC